MPKFRNGQKTPVITLFFYILSHQILKVAKGFDGTGRK
jgi:hypothetical protein